MKRMANRSTNPIARALRAHSLRQAEARLGRPI